MGVFSIALIVQIAIIIAVRAMVRDTVMILERMVAVGRWLL